MPFWKVQRGATRDFADGSAARDLAPRIESVQLFSADRRIEGWIVALEERMVDVLNSRETLRVCVDPALDAWETFDRDELLLVGPPPLPGPSRRAVHRQKQRVLVNVGPYVAEGVVYLPPGTPPDPYLLRARQRFLALTNAVVSRRDDPGSAMSLPVVLVNLYAVEEMQGLLKLA